MGEQAEIEIQCGGTPEPSSGPTKCVVFVKEGGSRTRHIVTVEANYRGKLCGDDVSLEELLRQSFRFLLKREAKESILREFNLLVISRYFPEYEAEMRRHFSSR